MRRLIGIGVAVLLAGCGAAVTHTSTTHTATQSVRPTATHAQTVTPKPPVRLALIGTHPYPFSGADTTVVPSTYLVTFTSNQQGEEINPDVGTVTFARPSLYKVFTLSQPMVTLTDPLTAANTRFNPTYGEMFDSPDYYWVTYSHHVWTFVQEVPTNTTPPQPAQGALAGTHSLPFSGNNVAPALQQNMDTVYTVTLTGTTIAFTRVGTIASVNGVAPFWPGNGPSATMTDPIQRGQSLSGSTYWLVAYGDGVWTFTPMMTNAEHNALYCPGGGQYTENYYPDGSAACVGPQQSEPTPAPQPNEPFVPSPSG